MAQIKLCFMCFNWPALKKGNFFLSRFSQPPANWHVHKGGKSVIKSIKCSYFNSGWIFALIEIFPEYETARHFSSIATRAVAVDPLGFAAGSSGPREKHGTTEQIATDPA